jgi:hypothetical protein
VDSYAHLVLGDRFVVGLLLVVGEHPTHPSFVPTDRVLWLLHDFFLLRRNAFSALGPRSYAVNTNTEPGVGSGT